MIPYLNKGQGNILMEDIKEPNKKQNIVYCSVAMKKLMNIIKKVAITDSSVLLTGKSGTGKEMIARRIHNLSYRNKKSFVTINCSCLNENLADSELFGHEKGAFTGATQKKLGLLEQADKGTIVLDEIGDLKPELQAKLLRFLQENEIYRLGSKTPIRLDVRVVCTTNKNLAEEVLKGRFREDLFYRINTISIVMPSLSERSEDILPLIKHFLGQDIQIEESTLTLLRSYNWPGNIRELQNLCERWRILNEKTNVITSNDLPETFTNGTNMPKNVGISYNPHLSLTELNKMYILSAIEHYPSKRAAAKALGITIKTLYNRLHEYDVFDKYSMHTSMQQEIV